MTQVMSAEMPPHKAQGTKRPPENELEPEQRLTKRFNRMNLDYVACAAQSPIPVSNTVGSGTYNPTPNGVPPLRRKRSDPSLMQVEETPHRVFIHDIDEELADEASDSSHPIFVPDIEKHLMKLPRSVLIGEQERKAMESMQMVLYKVPQSLSLPEEEDSVGRAIREARQRARDQQPFRIPEMPKAAEELAQDTDQRGYEYDPDAMEIE